MRNWLRRLRGTAVIAVCCLFVWSAQPVLAFGVSHVVRTDTPTIESVTITLKTQLQYYTKFVLSNLNGVTAIKELSELKDLYSKLTSYVDQAKSLQNQLSPDVLQSKISDVTGMINNIQTNVKQVDGIWGIFSSATNTVTGLTGAISQGSGSGLYPKDDLSSISNEEGFAGVAKAVVSRTSEALDKSLNQSTGNDSEKAVMDAYGYLVKAVPLINEDVMVAFVDSISSGAVFEGEAVTYYLAHLADAAKTPPTGAITEILDKYIAEESPYCEAKYMDAISKDMALITESLNEATDKGDSPQSKLVSYMGTMARVNELTMRQYENMNDIQADTIKIQGINAGLRSVTAAGSVMKDSNNAMQSFNSLPLGMKKIIWDKYGIKNNVWGK